MFDSIPEWLQILVRDAPWMVACAYLLYDKSRLDRQTLDAYKASADADQAVAVALTTLSLRQAELQAVMSELERRQRG